MKTSVKDVDQHDMVVQIAGFLKKSGKVKVPEWSDLVKLSTHKELAPIDPDWYFVRAASIARRLYFRSPTGIGALRTVYGGKHRHGVTPNHFKKCAGSSIRKALQTLEALKWVEKHADGRGRVLTKQGRKDLDRIASQLRQSTKAAAAAAATTA
uniref:Ribosomal protein S19 n=1 Tax=Plectus sambesii TaxID=2011161 RepID=A0A914WXK6_9BILA